MSKQELSLGQELMIALEPEKHLVEVLNRKSDLQEQYIGLLESRLQSMESYIESLERLNKLKDESIELRNESIKLRDELISDLKSVIALN